MDRISATGMNALELQANRQLSDFEPNNSMVKVQSGQCPSSAPGETGPLSAQPLPRVLELAASKAAHFAAFDHPGRTSTSMRSCPTLTRPSTQSPAWSPSTTSPARSRYNPNP
eukprot:scaffold101495_cov48-Phaeocystis_antarctica.AAC.2